MSKSLIEAKLEQLTQVLSQSHSRKPTEQQAVNFHLSFSQLFRQTESLLQKYEHTWPDIFVDKFQERLNNYVIVLNQFEAIINEAPQSRFDINVLNAAIQLYDSVFDEYTNSFGAYSNYSRYNQVSKEEKERIIEEIFLPHYMVINFLKNLEK
jgi:hypothetical protein